MIDFETIENAIQQWFAEATGICTIWRNLSSPQPPYPYAGLLTIAGPTKVGGIDEVRQSCDPTDVDTPVVLTTCSLRELTVSCQTYVAKPDRNDPNKNARALMSLAQTALGQISVIDKLSVAGVSVIEEGPIQNIDEVIENEYVSRANMDVRFMVASTAEERVTTIESFELTDTGTGKTTLIEFGV